MRRAADGTVLMISSRTCLSNCPTPAGRIHADLIIGNARCISEGEPLCLGCRAVTTMLHRRPAAVSTYLPLPKPSLRKGMHFPCVRGRQKITKITRKTSCASSIAQFACRNLWLCDCPKHQSGSVVPCDGAKKRRVGDVI